MQWKITFTKIPYLELSWGAGTQSLLLRDTIDAGSILWVCSPNTEHLNIVHKRGRSQARLSLWVLKGVVSSEMFTSNFYNRMSDITPFSIPLVWSGWICHLPHGPCWIYSTSLPGFLPQLPWRHHPLAHLVERGLVIHLFGDNCLLFSSAGSLFHTQGSRKQNHRSLTAT